MENKKEHLETIKEIRGLMERSSQFVSFSGVSAIAAGLTAIIGAVVTSVYLKIGFFQQVPGIMSHSGDYVSGDFPFILLIALIVFISALILSLMISSRRAKMMNITFWDSMAKRVFTNLFIFLFTGGVFILILFYYGIYFLIISSMLIFYGLALINVSKFTFNVIAHLGILEIILGIIAAFVTVYPLLMWTTGFGLLHLIYGFYVYLKYEREPG